MKIALPIAVALLVAIPAGSALAAGPVDPTNPFAPATADAPYAAAFAADLRFDPDVSDWIERSELQDCDGDESGAIICRLGGRWSDHGAPLSGTIVDGATGAIGRLRASCDVSGDSFVDFSIAPPENGSRLPVVDLVGAGGKARVSCVWRVRMNDQFQSVLVGVAHASGPLTAIDPGIALVGLPTDIELRILGGSGFFEGATGTGTSHAGVSYGLLGQSGELPIDFEIVGMGSPSAKAASVAKSATKSVSTRGIRAAAATSASTAGQLEFSLWHGRHSLVISTPKRLAARQLRRSVRGVTAPRARCATSATMSGRRVRLGESRADAGGIVRIPPAKINALTAGRWRVSMSCVSAGKTARDSARIQVTR
ncbi:MAG: hypothetical protein WAO61_00595 [Solirubrobacterales bacterium]